ncbi:MAG: thiamine phosphate synthase [Bacillota bacterium]|nr:thiamine phosphate synthase [Bacillota bacterium]
METAVALNKLCKKHRIPFIVNDSVELCLKADADGVHLGQEDGSLTEARKILGPSKIIGATAHNLEEALRAESEGADYIGVGAAFGSKTKMVSGAIDLNEYNRITQQVHIPVVAIGGIHAGNIDALYDRGISGVSVISAIFGDSHTSPEKIRDNALVLRRLAEHL